MTPEATDLARKLAAHERFDWRPGMRMLRGGNKPPGLCIPTGPECADLVAIMWDNRSEYEMYELPLYIHWDAHPNLTDWATVGALLGMLDKDAGTSWSLSGFLDGYEVTLDNEHGETRWAMLARARGEAVARALLEVWGG